jgi:DNA repair protein RecN (Recombination protein N)
MLRSLVIRDIVLIEALTLDLRPGLNVLTGETGAGKSILLDALGLALGRKGRADMLRPGASEGHVTAVFDAPDGHPAVIALREAGLAAEDGEVILRRVVGADGRARGFVNDQRASAEVMRRIGDALVEIHGQHDDRGLLDPAGHRALLDSFAGLDAGAVRAAWAAWRAAERAAAEAEAAVAAAERDAEFLRHAASELRALGPEPGEEPRLDAERRRMQAALRIREEVSRARADVAGAEAAAADAARRLERAAETAEGALDAGVAALDRALAEISEAEAAVAAALDRLEVDPLLLERVEERLFAMRALARKHQVAPDELPDLAASLDRRLAEIDGGEVRLGRLRGAAREAEARFRAEAAAVTAMRRAAAARLDDAMAAELPPLKMESARFLTRIEAAEPGPDGVDRATFAVATNPGAAPGPIDRIASGGELSRFLLALKVCLAGADGGAARTLIFDEIDRGVGGATAEAVGRRLSRLADSAQVLVVTHSPQVAAQAAQHWRIEKEMADAGARTRVSALDERDRPEEIARMLAGEVVTEAARKAALALLARRN